MIAILVTVSAAYSGIVPGIGYATVDFRGLHGYKTDSYFVLGRTGEVTYLASCVSADHGTLVVPNADIQALVYFSHPLRHPSLLDVLRGKADYDIGIRLNC
jgi:hypothetical protein